MDNFDMGDMASYYGQQEWLEDMALDTVNEPNIPTKLWKCNDGRLLFVDKMTTDHIINTIRAFNRGTIPAKYHGGKEYWMERFNEELKRRGENNVWK